MPKAFAVSCTICGHPDSARLLEELPSASLRDLERRYDVSRSVLSRHRLHGCPTKPTRTPRTTTTPSGELGRVVELLSAIKALLGTIVQQRGGDEESPGTGPPAIPWNRL